MIPKELRIFFLLSAKFFSISSPLNRDLFKKLKNQICKDHPDGFYVKTKTNLCSPDSTFKYINR